MDFIEREIKGVFEVILNPHSDDRGFFMRTYDQKQFKEIGLTNTWVQENHSRSLKKGVIRGFHFQFPPHAETKMVRVTRGEIMDVVVDLRKNSDTLGLWDSIHLTGDNMKAFIIPKGCAHGFCTLSDSVDMMYHHDNYYNKSAEGGIIWNDESIKVDWPEKNPRISDRDRSFLNFKQFIKEFKGL